MHGRPVAPVGQLVTSNDLTVGSWFRISVKSHDLRFFSHLDQQWKAMVLWKHKFRLQGRRGRGQLNRPHDEK